MKNFYYILGIFLPLHILAIGLLWYNDFYWINFLYFLIGYILIGGIGVEIGLHRWASHRSIKLNKIAKPIVLLFSFLGCQGHPIWWAAVHRGLHHRFADTEKDIHSPIHQGNWHASLGWIIDHDPQSVNYRTVPDLLKDKWLIKTKRLYEVTIFYVWLCVGYFDPNLLLWGLLIPAIVVFHGEGLINSLCHGSGGYRNFDSPDQSKNIPWLGYLMWGNGWHNNHHHAPSSFDFGRSISGKYREFDPCVLLLPLLKTRS